MSSICNVAARNMIYMFAVECIRSDLVRYLTYYELSLQQTSQK